MEVGVPKITFFGISDFVCVFFFVNPLTATANPLPQSPLCYTTPLSRFLPQCHRQPKKGQTNFGPAGQIWGPKIRPCGAKASKTPKKMARGRRNSISPRKRRPRSSGSGAERRGTTGGEVAGGRRRAGGRRAGAATGFSNIVNSLYSQLNAPQGRSRLSGYQSPKGMCVLSAIPLHFMRRKTYKKRGVTRQNAAENLI